jgi:hypothetical protein
MQAATLFLNAVSTEADWAIDEWNKDLEEIGPGLTKVIS